MADIAGECPLVGTPEDDLIRPFGAGDVDGRGGQDTIWGDRENLIRGGLDDDVIFGGGGDTIFGEAGDDEIWIGSEFDSGVAELAYGGKGDDTMFAGVGDQTLSGGSGDDAFQLMFIDGNSIDVIGGSGEDAILVSGSSLDTRAVSFSSVEHIVFDRDAQFAISESQIFTRSGEAKVSVSGGDGRSSLIIECEGASLNASKLVLENWDALDSLVIFCGDADEKIIGSSYADVIRSRGGDDFLNGGSGDDYLEGGDGADTMRGGEGDDYYGLGVGDAGDVVSEKFGAGVDTIDSASSIKLATNIEILRLRGGHIDGAGNGLDNAIIGGDGANVLNGRLGADTLTGGAGADTFTFDTPLRASNVDAIADFVSGEDVIALSAAVFGALTEASFHIGAEAQDADDRIIYDPTTGDLFFDRDGTGAKFASVRFAALAPETLLTAQDFVVV